MNNHTNSQLSIAANIVDTARGIIQTNQIVDIADGHIGKIRPFQPAGDESLLDLRAFTIMPGFIDTHLHITLNPASPDKKPYDPRESLTAIITRTIANAQSALFAGVTTIGDCGAENRVILPVRDAINNGSILGPRILASGSPIVSENKPGFDVGSIVKTVDDARKVVHSLAEAGVDFIKVMVTGGGGSHPEKANFDVPTLKAIREEASKHGLVTAAHAHGILGIRNCIEAGIQRIEHCTFSNGEHFVFDEEIAREIAQAGIIVSPTNVIDYRRWQLKGSGAPRDELNEVWRCLYRAGVLFAGSSDAGVIDLFYDDYALIPDLMVNELGMSPADALRACTLHAAKALRLDDEIGTIEVGKTADMVILAGNPLEDIQYCYKPAFVIRNGRFVYADNTYLPLPETAAL